MPRSGYAKGKTSGHITQGREVPPRPSASKGVSVWSLYCSSLYRFCLTHNFAILFYYYTQKQVNARVKLVRELVREVAGLSPYERRILDLIKTGGAAADKRVYKYAKKRLGSHKRALLKREDIKNVNAQQRARAAAGAH